MGKTPTIRSRSLSSFAPRFVVSLGYRVVFRKRRVPRSIFPLDIVRGHGLEVGGPSLFFQHSLPVYGMASRIDGMNFADETMWEGSIREGQPFVCNSKKLGTQFLGEATDLARFPDNSFDFVLSCHSLEHSANPLKALQEWHRVVRSEGHIVLVLPNKTAIFDHRRQTTTMNHLLEDFHSGVGEDDLTHLAEILELHDLTRDRAAGNLETFTQRSRQNYQNRGLHHHVFDLELLRQILNFFGIEEIASHQSYYDHLIVGRVVKPATESSSAANSR